MNHPLSAVFTAYLLCILAALLHIWCRSTVTETWARVLPWWHRWGWSLKYPRTFENWLPWKMLGPEVERVRKGWRKLRKPDPQLRDLYISRNIFRVIRSMRVGWRGTYEGEDNSCWGSMKESVFGRPRSRWGCNFKVDLEEMLGSSWTGLLWLIINSSLDIILNVGAVVTTRTTSALKMRRNWLTFWRRNFFQILAHPVFKMWVIQKPNKVALWNKRHFEEKKM
jgi:hypothetical protein